MWWTNSWKSLLRSENVILCSTQVMDTKQKKKILMLGTAALLEEEK